MPQQFPEEFRDDVIRVAMKRGPSVSIARVVNELGLHVGNTRQVAMRRSHRLWRANPRQQVRARRAARARERNRLLK